MPAFTRCGKRISSIKRCTATWPSPKTSICIRWHRAGIYLYTSRLFRLWKRMGGAKRKEKREKGRKATGENGHDTVKNHVGCFFLGLAVASLRAQGNQPTDLYGMNQKTCWFKSCRHWLILLSAVSILHDVVTANWYRMTSNLYPHATM
jgi:hypothetical protein